MKNAVHTNLPMTAHTSKEWYTTETPDFIQASARRAFDIMVKCGVTESRIALRDEVFTILVPHHGLLFDIFVMQTKDGIKTYSLSDLNAESRPHQVLFRIINGELYIHTKISVAGKTVIEERLDAYAWTDEELDELLPQTKRTVIGFQSETGRHVLQTAIDSLQNPRDKARLENLFKMYAIDFACGMQNADWRQVVEVTQEMIDAGLTSIFDDYAKPGDAPTQVMVGDFLVITKNGMYRIDRTSFIKSHSTFMI